MNARMSSLASRSIDSTLGSWRPSMPAMVSNWSLRRLGVGLGEDRCGSPRRPSRPVALGHLGQQVAHEVHPAALPGRAGRMAPIAACSPAWASQMTSWTPVRPRAFSAARNAVQNAPSSAVADVDAQHLPVPVGGHPGGDHHRLGHHPAIDPGLAVGRVEEHVGETLFG